MSNSTDAPTTIRTPPTWRGRVAGIVAMRLMRMALWLAPDTFAQGAEFWVAQMRRDLESAT